MFRSPPGRPDDQSSVRRNAMRLIIQLLVLLLALVGSLLLWRAHAGPPGRSLRTTSLPTMLAAALGIGHAASEKRKPNRLIHEKSPYLLQHAYNPVDWYAWGEEAFARARREDKPIFLSIGYSTCHWCHVMERESFENDSVAAVLNRYFVCIKVDREERPDVDRIYMTAMQAMGMGGGWPLNVFLTPDLHPFFGGTYFPPGAAIAGAAGSGRPGLMEIAPQVHEAWVSQRAAIEESGRRVIDALDSLRTPEAGSTDRLALFDSCAAALAASADPQHGGFGNAPKFPSIVNLDFLMRYWARDPAGHAGARELAVRQLEAMAAGGIHDHLGGGFHRYSTDREWLVPHFEKMLYDQAQIAWAFVEAYQATGRAEFAETARDIFAYVKRDLTSPDGAFWSAEDADSEGEEGKFYVWTPRELETALGKDDAVLAGDWFDVTPHGNFEHGASILHRVHTLDDFAARHHLSPSVVRARLEHARAALLDARSKRIRPYRDDKVIAAWNGLMISALARGARALDDPSLAEAASRAGEFAWTRLYDAKSGAMKRRWRDGEAAGAGQLDDYASIAFGYADLYQATLDPKWLERAAAITGAMIARFYDEKDGAFFESPAGDPSIAVRMKDDFDGAEIAGNSIAAFVTQQLAVLLDRPDWREKAHRTFDYYARRLHGHAVAMPRMLVAMDLEQSAPRHIVIAGDPAAADTRAMVHEFNRRFLPHDQILLVAPGASEKRLARLVPFTVSLTPKDGKATAYVCVNYACQLPITKLDAFTTQLDARPQTTFAAGGGR
jgi:uncharacterized protein YyaL (SSP411 family)